MEIDTRGVPKAKEFRIKNIPDKDSAALKERLQTAIVRRYNSFSVCSVQLDSQNCAIAHSQLFWFTFRVDGDEVLDQFFRENSARSKVVVVCFQSVKCVVKTGRELSQLSLFFVGKVIKVEIVRTPASFVWVNLVLIPSIPAIRSAA